MYNCGKGAGNCGFLIFVIKFSGILISRSKRDKELHPKATWGGFVTQQDREMGLVLLETWADSPGALREFMNRCHKQLSNPSTARLL